MGGRALFCESDVMEQDAENGVKLHVLSAKIVGTVRRVGIIL